MDTQKIALQDMAAPDGICFGCGSKNLHGLQLKSYQHYDSNGRLILINID